MKKFYYKHGWGQAQNCWICSCFYKNERLCVVFFVVFQWNPPITMLSVALKLNIAYSRHWSFQTNWCNLLHWGRILYSTAGTWCFQTLVTQNTGTKWDTEFAETILTVIHAYWTEFYCYTGKCGRRNSELLQKKRALLFEFTKMLPQKSRRNR